MGITHSFPVSRGHGMNQAKEELKKFPEKEAVEFINVGSMSRYEVCGSPLRSVKRFMSSSSLLKGFASMFGLWADRPRCHVLLALIFLFPETYNLIQSVAYGFVCPQLQNNLDSWFCGNGTRNISSSDVIDGLQFRINKRDLLDFVLKLAQPVSHLAFLWSVWIPSKKDEVIRQSHICLLVKPEQWLKLNCTIFLFIFAMVSSTLWLIIENITGSTPYLVSSIIYPIPLWASLLTCWIFGAYTSSLEILTSRMESDVTTSDDFDEIIALHQKLCKTISATSDAFKSASAFLSGTIYLFIYVYVFIYPCYCAASVTAKCQQMLTDFNMKYKYEWNETHPFRQRQQLHVFLKYASYANCGYKVGSLTFGSMSVFFSTLLAITGVGLKIFN
ncbi:hypothetical protein AC249_AIPGENE18861 [Exaiptasia diaphana]|nr:hypothetical protein AC249_AIPGENE18861 [Exaiptasia diaphana]